MLNKSTTINDSIKKGPIMFVMIIGAFLATFNQTIMSVAIPKLMNDFHINASTAQWLTTGYMLVNGVLIPITAFLMKRFTTRQLFQSSMIIFLVGTIASATAPNFALLLTGRLIQAAGAGIIMPLLTNVVLSLFPPEKRGSAMGMVGLAIIFAPAIGPTLAGYVLETFPWQAMFYGMIPFAVIVIICGFIYLKNVSETVRSHVDIISVILSTIAFGALIYGFSEAGNNGWSSKEVMVSIIAGIISLALFTWRQLISHNPLLNLRAFTYKMFTLTTIINLGITMMLYADMMILPLYLQNARGFTALESGILMFPGALLMGLLSPAVGKLFDRFGAKWLIISGITIIILSTISFISLTDSTSYTYLILMSTLRRIGVAMVIMPIQTEGLNQLPSGLYAHGTAISNTIRQVAGAIGTALLVTVMTNSTNNFLQDTAGETSKHMMMEASIKGVNDAYLVILIIGIISLVLSFFIKRDKKASGDMTVKKTAEM
ncbi:MAG: DHA2 family efflux MFS transporter permease subunit [Bacillota bacterium]